MQVHRIRTAIVALGACAALAAPAAAEPGADYPYRTEPASVKIGDTPADFAQPGAPSPKGGDTPADFPGASRAPEYVAPTTIAVVRPERTVVRDVDEVLPLVLSSAALLIVLGGGALLFVTARRGRLGTH